MESWSYGSEGGKGFLVSDEVISLSDARERSGRNAMGWNSRTHCNFDSNIFVPGGFMELGFPEITKKSLPDNPIGGGGGVGVLGSPPTCVVSPKAFLQEDSSSRFSSSAVDSSSRDLGLFDLKLGRLTDCRDAQMKSGGPSKQTTPVINTISSSVPAKRARTTSLNSQIPYCQVLGCDLDLSSSKDYYKRHRVCDAHSKTAKVIVNGIDQRFCQQCSRFHLLAEFDDGKRSCRKRLAGHNQRRRKPQLNHSSRTGDLLSMYQGNRFLGTPFSSRTSFICPDIFPNSIPHSTKYETSNWCKQLKLEHETVDDPQSVIPFTNGLPRSFFPPYGSEEQYPSVNGNGIVTGPQSILFEKNNHYPHDLSSPNCVSQSFFRNTTSGSEEFTAFDTASTIQGVSGVSDSCALSLLSTQSQNSSSHSSGNPLAQPLIIQGSHAHQSISPFPEKILGASSQASTSVASNKFSSSGMNSLEVDHMEPVLVSDDSDVVNFEVHTEGMFQGSDLVDARDSLTRDQGPTVDLLQLSSHLQRVEHQRHFLQAKQENDIFCCFPNTLTGT